MKYIIILTIWFLNVGIINNCDCIYQGQQLPNICVTSTIPQLERVSKLVYVEGRGMPDNHLKAIAQVVVNRSEQWSMSIDDVMTEPGQFDGLCNENYLKPYGKHIYSLIKPIYHKEEKVHDYLFFLNPKSSTDTAWVKIALSKEGQYIDSHYFFNF